MWGVQNGRHRCRHPGLETKLGSDDIARLPFQRATRGHGLDRFDPPEERDQEIGQVNTIPVMPAAGAVALDVRQSPLGTPISLSCEKAASACMIVPGAPVSIAVFNATIAGSKRRSCPMPR